MQVYSEIFAEHSRVEGKGFEEIIDEHWDRKLKKIKHVGFKVFYYHLAAKEWEQLLNKTDFKVIHLVRENKLRTIVSLEIARQTSRWKSKGDRDIPLQEKQIVLDCGNLLDRVRSIEAYESEAEMRFSEWDMLKVSYEEMLLTRDQVLGKIEKFLGIQPVQAERIKIKKQNRETLQDLILNYEEVEKTLRNTSYAIFLDEPLLS